MRALMNLQATAAEQGASLIKALHGPKWAHPRSSTPLAAAASAADPAARRGSLWSAAARSYFDDPCPSVGIDTAAAALGGASMHSSWGGISGIARPEQWECSTAASNSPSSSSSSAEREPAPLGSSPDVTAQLWGFERSSAGAAPTADGSRLHELLSPWQSPAAAAMAPWHTPAVAHHTASSLIDGSAAGSSADRGGEDILQRWRKLRVEAFAGSDHGASTGQGAAEAAGSSPAEEEPEQDPLREWRQRRAAQQGDDALVSWPLEGPLCSPEACSQPALLGSLTAGTMAAAGGSSALSCPSGAAGRVSSAAWDAGRAKPAALVQQDLSAETLSLSSSSPASTPSRGPPSPLPDRWDPLFACVWHAAQCIAACACTSCSAAQRLHDGSGYACAQGCLVALRARPAGGDRGRALPGHPAQGHCQCRQLTLQHPSSAMQSDSIHTECEVAVHPSIYVYSSFGLIVLDSLICLDQMSMKAKLRMPPKGLVGTDGISVIMLSR